MLATRTSTLGEELRGPPARAASSSGRARVQGHRDRAQRDLPRMGSAAIPLLRLRPLLRRALPLLRPRGGRGLREDIDTVLEPGMVVSMEPMIMIPEGTARRRRLPRARHPDRHRDGAENITGFPFGPSTTSCATEPGRRPGAAGPRAAAPGAPEPPDPACTYWIAWSALRRGPSRCGSPAGRLAGNRLNPIPGSLSGRADQRRVFDASLRRWARAAQAASASDPSSGPTGTMPPGLSALIE